MLLPSYSHMSPRQIRLYVVEGRKKCCFAARMSPRIHSGADLHGTFYCHPATCAELCRSKAGWTVQCFIPSSIVNDKSEFS